MELILTLLSPRGLPGSNSPTHQPLSESCSVSGAEPGGKDLTQPLPDGAHSPMGDLAMSQRATQERKTLQ